MNDVIQVNMHCMTLFIKSLLFGIIQMFSYINEKLNKIILQITARDRFHFILS